MKYNWRCTFFNSHQLKMILGSILRILDVISALTQLMNVNCIHLVECTQLLFVFNL